ncbi:LOW QUALITY PROTEIN: sialic acid synthase [Homalodisca vitripennis]|uniref:LOW QUALITY PROTEIN: sialic acid synthase n=1 Tax=Homalodisca vitripennis TaxID=197043 RepID=UPI001EEB4433|nr:LOW QUALITY PROTEIN: sialic acid synthase [Homalodisca vitripennis]
MFTKRGSNDYELMATSSPVVLLANGQPVGGESPCFIIAEIGQNHQGNVSIAKDLILAAKQCGADCVKFQKSDLLEKFTSTALARPYLSTHSWGKTYGEHKAHLEFSDDEYEQLKKYAQEIDILFTASGMDQVSITVLDSWDVPFIKIGSGDSDNILLIKKAAKLHRPLFISTGMLDMDGVRMIHQAVTQFHRKLVLLHCVSAYPTPAAAVNLRVLQLYQQQFPDVPIGYSGHELGTSVSVAAVALGAKVIERHLTLSKEWKGSDHVCSLEPDEFAQMVRDIRQVELALGSPIKQFLPCEVPCQDKLGKSVVAAEDLLKGLKISEENIKIKVSHPAGIRCKYLNSLIGKTLVTDVRKDEPINFFDVS